MINQVRDITGKPTGINAVLGDMSWVTEFLDEIERSGIEHAPDFFTFDSSDGGIGAAPQALMDNVGLPLRQSLPLLVDLLNERGFKQRIKVIATGKMIMPSYVAWALATGANFIASARGNMFALGCIQSLRYNKDTRTGITTHNKQLQKGLNSKDKSARVANYNHFLYYDLTMIAHLCGVTDPRYLTRHLLVLCNLQV
jgi:glutamate synthase domain-containing protein 2